MKISKESRWACLTMLYLCRAGKAHVSDIAANLNVDDRALAQVLTDLSAAGLVRLDDGVAATIGNPTLAAVLKVFENTNVLPSSVWAHFKDGGTEHRAFLLCAKDLRAAIQPILNKTFPRLVNDLVMAEAYQLANLDEKGGVQ